MVDVDYSSIVPDYSIVIVGSVVDMWATIVEMNCVVLIAIVTLLFLLQSPENRKKTYTSEIN